MICLKPFRKGGSEFGCGQCLPCRINRRRQWTARLLLEARCHDVPSLFVTLTYAQLKGPRSAGVLKRDVQLFLKRLRYFGEKVRYYAVGEYGDRFGRPHYHLAIFGCRDHGNIAKAWSRKSIPIGHVDIREIGPESAAYIVSYILKGSTRKRRTDGRPSEFSLQSTNPGIGALAVPKLAQVYNSSSGMAYIGKHGDVPMSFRTDGSDYPLGKYMRKKLREELGVSYDIRPGTELDVKQKVMYVRDSASGFIVDPDDPFKRKLLLKSREERRKQEARKAIWKANFIKSKKGNM